MEVIGLKSGTFRTDPAKISPRFPVMANKFHRSGYAIQNIIFWNVNSRHDVFHADHSRKGVQLASGQSVTVFKQILQNLGYNPVEAMENTINSERYDCIRVEEVK